ncbi:MAG: hypothetical protein ABW252_25795 [Polyangiales bacterium]
MGRLRLTLACLGTLVGAMACDTAKPASPDHSGRPSSAVSDGTDAPDQPAPYPVSSGRSVQWKRAAAIEADLMRSLELARDEVCTELGALSCIRAVHTVALGTNDPFATGLLKPALSPLSTTPLVIDRVTLSACAARARADREGSARVFTALDLAGPAPAADADAVTETITTLFRRMLARDPKPGELTTVRSLLTNDDEKMTAEEFATLSCFVVASSLESLFF